MQRPERIGQSVLFLRTSYFELSATRWVESGSLIMSRFIFYILIFILYLFFFFLKGKLPPMIGHDQPSSHNGNRQSGDNKVQLSAGDLLGRTHEELVLLLIQLRRQSSALVKARDACLLEMESQVL